MTWTDRGLDLCRGCEADLPWNDRACSYCGLPMESDGELCLKCLTEPPLYSAALCPFRYEYPVDLMIQRFKTSRHLANGIVLTSLLISRERRTLATISDPDTVVTPIPLHWRRRLTRGFNQPAIIAREISKALALHLDHHLLVRQRHTPEQKIQVRGRRTRNLTGAFRTTRDLNGQRILLVDDVITTTATVTEATRSLMAAGAADVVIISLARTPAGPH